MDLLDLALNPRKAAMRFSPFTNELPEYMARKLEYLFGDLVSTDEGELALYSRDASSPPSAMRLLLKRDAWAVVRPRIRGDLIELIKFANQNNVPLVPRGSGTSGYGGSVPTEGGIVVDMRDFNKVLAVDPDGLTVRCEGNVTFADLEKTLRESGLALRQYPTSYFGATVAGWVAQGGGGVGSAKYGPFKKDVLEVTLVQPDGATAVLDGEDLDLANEVYGTTGFIVEVVLKVRKDAPIVPYVATLPDLDAAALTVRRIAREAGAYSLHVHAPDYADLVNEAAKANLLPKGKWSVMVALEDVGNPAQVELLKGIVQSAGGSFVKDADAIRAWDARFDHLNVKRLGPSVVVSEAVVAADRFKDAYLAASEVASMESQAFWAIAVAPGELDLIYYGLEDERRPTYPAALGNALAIIDAVRDRAGGRPYSHGVLQVNEAKAILGKARIKAVKRFRKETDPKDVFNPGPVVGGRSRPMPLPVKDLALQLALAAPLIKAQRGSFSYRGGAKADPSSLAVSRAIGRVNAGELAAVDYDVTTCIFCAACNHVAPERAGASTEAQLPRGRVQLAKALIEGRIEPTREMHRKAARTPLAHNPDAICPVLIPIARATDLLLGACVDALGPLPEHAALAENATKEGNVLGKPKDGRTKWSALAWTTDARTLYFADDIASYEVPEIATSAAQIIMNSGLQLAYLAHLERTSGAALVETGQREAAKDQVIPMLTEMTKRGVDSIITPDANALRVMKLDWPVFARGEDGLTTPYAMHSTVAIAQYLKKKQVEVGEPWAEKVAYHAPEGLTPEERAAGVDILKAMGADVVELPHHECGHGRALDKLVPALAQAIGEDCLKAYADTGAKVIVTASPGCYQTLKTVAKKAKAGVEVVDLHVAFAERMKTKEGGAVAVPVAAPAEEEKPKEPEIGPDQYRVEFVKEGVVLAVGKNDNILQAGEEAGLELPSSCRAGSCDTCSAKWEGTPPDQSSGEALTLDQQKTYVLTCIARPKGPVKIWSDERPG